MEDAAKECQGTCSDGVDWEVVSMTASMYAASPGPIGLALPKGSKDKESNQNEKEGSSPLFMSSHFEVPMEHENLKLKAKNHENDCMFTDIGLTPSDERSSTMDRNLEESFITKFDDCLHGIQFYEKDKGISVSDVVIGEGKSVQEMNLVLEEQVLSASHDFDSYHVETGMDEPFTCDEQADKPKLSNPSCQTPGFPSNDPNSVVQNDDQSRNETGRLPCGTWWKRHAITLYNHAKEANTFWSVIVAAALVGLVILGQRKRQEKPPLQQLRLHFGTNAISL